MVRDYLELEKKRLGEQLDIDVQVKGHVDDKTIALFCFCLLLKTVFWIAK